MRINNLGESVFDSSDIIDIIYQGHIDKISKLIVDQDVEILQLQTALNISFQKPTVDIDQTQFDYRNQNHWIMPQHYKDLDIEQWIYDQGAPWDPDHSRIKIELAEFHNRNMIDLLRWLKYFVDTCKANHIVWGVGRGSSVASYVLFLIGVHRINSIKYNLEFSEFMR